MLSPAAIASTDCMTANTFFKTKVKISMRMSSYLYCSFKFHKNLIDNLHCNDITSCFILYSLFFSCFFFQFFKLFINIFPSLFHHIVAFLPDQRRMKFARWIKVDEFYYFVIFDSSPHVIAPPSIRSLLRRRRLQRHKQFHFPYLLLLNLLHNPRFQQYHYKYPTV